MSFDLDLITHTFEELSASLVKKCLEEGGDIGYGEASSSYNSSDVDILS